MSLAHVTVIGVDAHGIPLATPTADRGFIAQDERGRMTLHDDTFLDLGHYGSLAYGVSLSNAGARSSVVGCTMRGNYIGIYLTRSKGVRIEHNTIQDSVLYGIDPHTHSVHLLIEGNQVLGSGLHGIILAEFVSDSTVSGNTITGAVEHGIVLYDHSDGNTVIGNVISGTFDGIVIQGSSGNTVTGNAVQGAKRFALRLGATSGGLVATGNRVQGNLLSGALIGIYAYQGSTQNSLLGNRFRGNLENVRIRADAPGNRVEPIPPASELAS